MNLAQELREALQRVLSVTDASDAQPAQRNAFETARAVLARAEALDRQPLELVPWHELNRVETCLSAIAEQSDDELSRNCAESALILLQLARGAQ